MWSLFKSRIALVGCLLLVSQASATRRLSTKGMERARQKELGDAATNCRISDTISCPAWLCAKLLGLFFDVTLYCKFPAEEKVFSQIEEDERRILTLQSQAILKPGNASYPLNFMELRDDVTEEHLSSKLTELSGGPMQEAIGTLMTPHEPDTCKGKLEPATSADEIFDNIKEFVDEFDIFTKCTKTYVKRKNKDGRPQISANDVVAISTELAAGMFALSYEDVSLYEEYIVNEGGKQVRILKMIISSRKENVIEGNYNIVMRSSDGQVNLEYLKRQNLAEPVLRSGISYNEYGIVTQRSVDATIRKLAYAGLYGRDAFSEDGCHEEPSWACTDYASVQTGEPCQRDLQCKVGKCVGEVCT